MDDVGTRWIKIPVPKGFRGDIVDAAGILWMCDWWS
jgi:hypothetical protein